MKIHFFTSRTTLNEEPKVIGWITDAIVSNSHSLATNWMNEAEERNKMSANEKADWVAIFKKNLEDVAQADVVIAEASYDSFAVGYQVAIAVQQKKPTLILRHAALPEDVFAGGVVDEWVMHRRYKDENELKKIVTDFLKENDIQTKDMRFNFFIDRPIYNYLRWTSLKTGKTKAEILRELVEKEIDRSNG